MNHRENHAQAGSGQQSATPAQSQPTTTSAAFSSWLRLSRWLPGSVAAVLWVLLVYELPLHSLRTSRQFARVELTHLLQADKPDTAAVLDAFDRATEAVLFSASGPYLILALATVFLIAHLVGIKRRLNAAERNIQVLRDVVLGVEGVSLK